MRTSHAYLAAGLAAIMLFTLSACVSGYSTEYSLASPLVEDCKSLKEKHQTLAKKAALFKDQLFKASRSVCADLAEYHVLRKASGAAEVDARRICPPGTFSKMECGQTCLEKELEQISSVKERYCSKK